MVFDVIIGRSKKDIGKFGTRGTVLIGKQYVKMGQTTSLSNLVYLDVAGAHVVFIVGKRGSGKCLLGDSIITLANGKQVKIEDLKNNKDEIISLNNNLKLENNKKSHFYEREVDKILELKLKTGKTIKLTPEHPLYTIKGWNPVEKLKIGDKIATPRILNINSNNKLSFYEAKLLAYLIAEGHMRNKFVLFTNKDEKIKNEFKKSIKLFDDTLITNYHSDENTFRIVQYKKNDVSNPKRNNKGQFLKGIKFNNTTSIKKWLEKLNLYGLKSIHRFIPEIIFTASKKNIALFLNRLFSCDGTIYKKNNLWFIGYSSSSEKLIKDVQHLLLRFGILSKIRKKKIKQFDTFELDIYGEEVISFIKQIGFYGEKEKRAKNAITESANIIRNPNNDTIPKEIWDIYRPKNWATIGEKMGYKIPKSLRSSINYAPSRNKLKTIAEIDNNKEILKIAKSDIYWDEIVSKKIIKGKFKVYDLTVPETHNFIANDIIVHNSYTMGSIAEGLSDLDKEIKQNLAIVLIDTMGIYWTMKYPNYKDAELLKAWGYEPKGLDVQIYTPEGFYYKYKEEGIPTDYPFSLRPIDVEPNDWCTAFNISTSSAEGVLITKICQELNKKEESYDIDDLIDAARNDPESDRVTKSIVINQFDKVKGWEIFRREGTALKDIIAGGQVTVLDVSPYATMASGWEIKALVVGLISRVLFQQRMLARKSEEFETVDSAMHYFTKDTEEKMQDPLVWLAIDEAHEMLPREGKTAASDALITILREGRQPGISLILATQQPAKIHTDVMTQSDTVIAHRLTAKMDTEALGLLMQSYMRKGLDEELNILPRLKGAALIFDDTNERLFPVQMKPRFTWHGGSSPTAIRERKNDFEKNLRELKEL